MPARIINLCDTISASEGASLSVEMKNWDAFMRLTIRDGRGNQYREDKGKSHRNRGMQRGA